MGRRVDKGWGEQIGCRREEVRDNFQQHFLAEVLVKEVGIKQFFAVHYIRSLWCFRMSSLSYFHFQTCEQLWLREPVPVPLENCVTDLGQTRIHPRETSQ